MIYMRFLKTKPNCCAEKYVIGRQTEQQKTKTKILLSSHLGPKARNK